VYEEPTQAASGHKRLRVLVCMRWHILSRSAILSLLQIQLLDGFGGKHRGHLRGGRYLELDERHHLVAVYRHDHCGYLIPCSLLHKPFSPFLLDALAEQTLPKNARPDALIAITRAEKNFGWIPYVEGLKGFRLHLLGAVYKGMQLGLSLPFAFVKICKEEAKNRGSSHEA
jgi:hypothetical protein